MIEGKQREAWIDIMKCIGITAVVIYHADLTHGELYGIESFAIPLFFFIAGYLFNPDVTFRNLLQRGFNSLLKPYFFTVILISLIYVIFKKGPAVLWYLFWIFYGNGPNLPKLALHLWFLPCLFVTMVFAWLALKHIHALKNSPIVQVLFISGLLVCGTYLIHIFWNLRIPLAITDLFGTNGHLFIINGLVDNPNYPKAQLLKDNQFILRGLPWSLDTVFITTALYITGYAVHKNKIRTFFHKGIFALIMTFVYCTLLYLFDYQFDIGLRQYNHLLWLTIQIFAGIYVTMYLSNIIGNWNNAITQVLKYIGKYSLIIYIFHPYTMRLAHSLISQLNLPNGDSIAIFPILVAGIGLPLLLNYLVFERFKFFRFWYYAK